MSLKDVLGKIVGDKPVVLELDMARGVLVAKPTNPLQAIQLINSPTISALREHLHAAADDDRVLGLIVHANPTQLQLANLEEVAGLIEEFGEKKKTMAWAESFGELVQGLGGYRLAAAAQKVWVQPTGMLSIEGVELSITLLKGLLNKVGVEPQFGQRHEYKSAANTFAADTVTEPHREMMQRIGQSIVDRVVDDVARLRGLTADTVWEAVNSSPVEPQRALTLGLIDYVGYRDEAYAHTLKQWGAEPENLLFAHRYTSRAALLKKLRPKQPKVAVVSLRGSIVTGRGVRSPMGGEQAGADVVDEHFRAALRDDEVKAVVFAVDSPGGSAVASDFIRRAVLRLREADKPVVAHMGAYAASGGYYVSMPCNEIVAQSSTLTGSIGVLAGKMVTEGLYDKLGLVRETIPVGAAAGTFSSAHEFSQEDWERLDRWLDRIYLDFTTFAAADRGMAYEDLERLARGRVWTGADAKERGLVDHLGGQRLAIERACDLAGLDPEAVKISHVGDSGLFDLIKPATSSEAVAGGAGLAVPEQMLVSLAGSLGIRSQGALSMPWNLRIS
ncbi:signal peptide peptidase SppA [Tessaracoccus sp. MC1756]|uniref:signal peptide peptidase SppA n=1 Tax=Tessaracoccus sp. MC1756 TaxID=2760311 RepID=UPI00160077E2|nr:signal peptide peptidase SppA [Tessaracoccus sp. MC1756]MBB1509553.1 signal peptide peptidase SppA [Tessaracoccus sp. MC1756]